MGQTKWNLNPFEVHNLVYNATLTCPGIYNIGPLVTITEYEPVEGQADDEKKISTYSLHSPIILSHK